MGDKKAKKGQDEDDSTNQVLRKYKNKSEQNGVPVNKLLKSKFDAAIDEDEHLEKLYLWDYMGPVGVRSFADSLLEVDYKHLKILRLWKVDARDEGVRTICNYMLKSKTIEYLDLLDNNITKLGCEFLSKVLSPNSDVPLQQLKLDHNQFGSEGLSILTQSLSQNKTLLKLSLSYCNIDENGSKFLQQILANIDCVLQKLRIKGNILKNEGAYQLFRAIAINNSLEKINIADNQINFEDIDFKDIPLFETVVNVLKSKENLFFYDFRNNVMGEEDGLKIIECIEQNKTICKCECPQTLSQPILDRIKQLTKKRKPKKKKKGKKKGKK